jgi:hypothetical protein
VTVQGIWTFNGLVESCDFNFDGNLDYCELFECVIIVENDYRLSHCPEYYGELTCPECEPPVCDGAKDCIGIVEEVELNFTRFDTNHDG